MKGFDPISEFENDLRSAMTYLDPPPDLMERMIAVASRPIGRNRRFASWVAWPAVVNLAVWRKGLVWMSVAASLSVASLLLFNLEQRRHAPYLKATRDFVISQRITEEVLAEARAEFSRSDLAFGEYRREANGKSK